MNRKDLLLITRHGDDSPALYKAYDKVMLIAIVVSLIPLVTRSNSPVLYWIDITTTTLFIIDYILRWVTADYRMKQSGWKAYLLYPFTIGAILDLLSILPMIGYFNSSLKVLRMWRLMKIFRVARVFRYYEPLQVMISVLRKKAEVLMTIVGFAIFYILTTALVMFNIEQPVNPSTGAYFFETYFDAVYWATCTLTTVGYGDIYPISNLGRLFSMVSAILGIAIIALPSGIITAGYMEEMYEKKKERDCGDAG
ncbi:ion transporter [Porphyromonas sp.]|uniref:ion transporter n=1 Tax=Porphyromonas sp. TaxID=1924944 RepID=UPI0026DC04DD|nr:ion transporter [Porphyromonas sp.]MDO4770767.1 ion transporter [Porphyromonas sp.]